MVAGVGPTLSQTLQPLSVPLFPALGVQVLSVACGKLHTLALTTNGVSSSVQPIVKNPLLSLLVQSTLGYPATLT